MGCGTSMNDSQIMKKTTSPKKLPLEVYSNQKAKVAQTDQVNKVQLPNPDAKKSPQQKLQTQSIAEDIRVDAKQQQQQYKAQCIESMQCLDPICQSLPQIKQGKIYLFGQSVDQRKIISLNLEQLKFQVLASRSSKIQGNNKYQPSDVIFQESQELQASHLYNRYSHPPYNFMFATYINAEKIFLSGGINSDFQYVSDQTFIYQIKKNQKISLNNLNNLKGSNLLGLKFDKLQFMNRKRYSHMGVYFPMGKLAYIFIFGGRGQDDQTMNHCEKYSLYQKKWTQIAPMKMPRSTGFSLIFNGKIYVFGGYTNEKKRTKKIEVYDPIRNYWEVLDVKLHRGIEAGLVFSTKPNEILIMGGNMEMGTLKSVIKVNLAEKTYIWDSNMKNERFLQKGGQFNDHIFIFGGDFQDTFEKYTLKDRKWRDQHVSYKNFISPDDINSFTLASETIQVQFDQSLIIKADPVNDFDRTHIFGNDQFPCILQINLSKWVLKKKPVPMSLRLRCNMAVVKIKQGKYFILGGIDSFNEKCSKAAFMYYAGTNKAIQVGKMSHKKYEMAQCVYGQNAYIFGGRSGLNGQILSVCQKFDLVQEKWSPLTNLSRERAKARTLVHKEKILIWGGCDSLQNMNQIQIFDPKTEQFSIFSKSIPMSSQITGVLYSPEAQSNQIIIFSYNDLLNELYCHSCSLDEQQNEQDQERKLQQGTLICSSDLKIHQIKVKLANFNSVFKFGQNIHFITNKGVLTWNYNKNKEFNALKPQIIINQVQMLQFPVDKFSFVKS